MLPRTENFLFFFLKIYLSFIWILAKLVSIFLCFVLKQNWSDTDCLSSRLYRLPAFCVGKSILVNSQSGNIFVFIIIGLSQSENQLLSHARTNNEQVYFCPLNPEDWKLWHPFDLIFSLPTIRVLLDRNHPDLPNSFAPSRQQGSLPPLALFLFFFFSLLFR